MVCACNNSGSDCLLQLWFFALEAFDCSFKRKLGHVHSQHSGSRNCCQWEASGFHVWIFQAPEWFDPTVGPQAAEHAGPHQLRCCHVVWQGEGFHFTTRHEGHTCGSSGSTAFGWEQCCQDHFAATANWWASQLPDRSWLAEAPSQLHVWGGHYHFFQIEEIGCAQLEGKHQKSGCCNPAVHPFGEGVYHATLCGHLWAGLAHLAAAHCFPHPNTTWSAQFAKVPWHTMLLGERCPPIGLWWWRASSQVLGKDAIAACPPHSSEVYIQALEGKHLWPQLQATQPRDETACFNTCTSKCTNGPNTIGPGSRKLLLLL